MKLLFLCLFLLHVSLVDGRIFTRHDHRKSPANPQRTGAVTVGRQRTLFARRGQYERQRIHHQKHKQVPVSPNNLPVKSTSHPAPQCSQLTQSCLPQTGCCDTFAKCHCHFFNAICFCRRLNSPNKLKT
ncbi:agouti-signaling protein-like isoform X1 [Synchiropus splendidus]|uniref:agouti-signaling protein-like isoform X1 n=1 Tax=Synchiropus splendidus TaxID=270530 RepID=UPI00237DC9D2|nr:agouti-signaling protein-like isoform X1 [Synchiropus splendidus]